MNPSALSPGRAACSRRDFLQRTPAVAALAAASAHGAGAARTTPRSVPRLPPGPNSKIHLGLIGCGGMGRANLTNCAQYPDVVVTAACDVWARRRDSVVAQFKATCRPYHDFRELLARPRMWMR